ncbi:transmembrane 7 superfamily member 3 [Sergentomyia squamirostris]
MYSVISELLYWFLNLPDLKMVIIIVGGVIFAISWTILWLQCHSVTEVADILASIINGYTLACLFLYWFGDWNMMESPMNYWMLFSVFIFSVSLLSFPLSRRGAIVNSALQGAIYMSITLLFMFDGNLQYAIINNWRRLKEASFANATIIAHLDLVDHFCAIIWAMSVMSGIFIQTRIVDGGCSCFGRRSTRPPRHRDEEVQPLIARLTARELGSDDVFLSPQSNSRFMSRFKRSYF